MGRTTRIDGGKTVYRLEKEKERKEIRTASERGGRRGRNSIGTIIGKNSEEEIIYHYEGAHTLGDTSKHLVVSPSFFHRANHLVIT